MIKKGMLEKAASGVLALLPCSRTMSTLRASKWLRPCWTNFFEHSLPLTMRGSSGVFIGCWSEIFNRLQKQIYRSTEIFGIVQCPRAGSSFRVVGLVLAAVLCLTMLGCIRAPGTARDQIIFISEEKEIALGISAFRDVLRQARLNGNPKINAMVNRVGQRIAAVANKPEYHWEFAVIQDDEQINAFALPGGKVAIFTGILKYTKTEAGLATVMAHEIAHALQRHGAERMSRGILEQIMQLGALAGAASGVVDPQLALGAMSAYGVGVSLPHNRRQESEADFIGLQLMAKAGYDPREAIGFWERMSGCPRQMIGRFCFRSQSAIPEFLSTHPSDVTRIKQIEAWIEDALQFYHPEEYEASPATKEIAKGM